MISIVMIGYNAEKTLDRAMKSVLRQSVRDIEMILVDDCSDDRTLEMMREYAAADPRITVLHHERNMGIFGARYTGIMKARGTYTLLMDPDDELMEDACEQLEREMERQHVDLLCFGTQCKSVPERPASQTMLDTLKQIFLLPEPSELRESYQPGELLSVVFSQPRLCCYVWNKLYRTELLKQAVAQYRGERILLAEDWLLTFMVLCYVRTIGIAAGAYYVYYVGNGISTSENRLNEQKMQQWAEAYQIYTLSQKWLGATGVSMDLAQPAMQRIHSDISLYCLWNLFFATPYQDCALFHRHLSRYYPKEDFVGDIIRYAMREWKLKPEIIAGKLRNYPPFYQYERIEKIRTVALMGAAEQGIKGRLAAALAETLASLGYKIVILEEKSAAERAWPEGVTRLSLQALPSEYELRVDELQKHIGEQHIDAAVVFESRSESLLLDALAIKSMSIPLALFSYPGAASSSELCGQQHRYGLFDRVFTLSDVDDAWWTALGYATHRVTGSMLYPPGRKTPKRDQSMTCLCVFRPELGQPYLHDAIEIAWLVHEQLPEFRMEAVCVNTSASEMESVGLYLKERNMDGYVRLHADSEEPRTLYRDAALCVAADTNADNVLWLMESRAYGIPAIAYPMPWLDEKSMAEGILTIPRQNAACAADSVVRVLQGAGMSGGEEPAAHRDELKERWEMGMEALLSRSPADRPAPLQTAVRLAMDCVEGYMEHAVSGDAYAQQQNVLGQLQAQIHAAEQEQCETKKQHAELSGRYDELSGRYAELSGRHAELSGQHAELIDQHVELSSQYAELLGQHSELSSQYAGLVRQYDELRCERSSLLNMLRADLKRCKRRIIRMGKKILGKNAE